MKKILALLLMVVATFSSCTQGDSDEIRSRLSSLEEGQKSVNSHIVTPMKKTIATNNAPAAIGPYSQAVEANGMLFISGQIAIDPSTGEFASDNVTGQTEQVFKNLKAILEEAGCTTDNIVKTTVFLSDISLFAEMNSVYALQFGETFPARSTIAVKGLPKNALVEIEAIAVK